MLGVDAVEDLVARAREFPGEYCVCSYQELEGRLIGERFSRVVANFSLLGEGCVEAAIAALPALLEPQGEFILQTLHPASVEAKSPGWRREDWTAMPSARCQPSPWYFRTRDCWFSILNRHGLEVIEELEPQAPAASEPSSLILRAKVQRNSQG